MKFKIGQIVTKENNTQAAIGCNQAGDRTIEEQDGQYVIVPNSSPTVPTVREKVRALEIKTGLTRAVRELVLAEGSGASDYVKQQAQEIEALAAPLREEEQ